MEFEKLYQILDILDKNQKSLDKHKKQYAFFKEMLDKHRKDDKRDFNLLLDIIQHGEDKTIYELESYIGMYKIGLSYSIDSLEFLNETLESLKKDLRQKAHKK